MSEVEKNKIIAFFLEGADEIYIFEGSSPDTIKLVLWTAPDHTEEYEFPIRRLVD